MYFEAKVKFLRQQDNGLIKPVTELYLIEADRFMEAEHTAEMQPGSGKEVEVMTLKRSNIKEVSIFGTSDTWYKVKCEYVVTDDDSEKEKKIATYVLVDADSSNEAYDRVQEHLKDMMVPFKLPVIQETKILEVVSRAKI